MNLSKEEIAARSAAFVYLVVVLIGLFQGVSIGQAFWRGLVCSVPVLFFLGQWIGAIWVKHVSGQQRPDF